MTSHTVKLDAHRPLLQIMLQILLWTFYQSFVENCPKVKVAAIYIRYMDFMLRCGVLFDKIVLWKFCYITGGFFNGAE
jgi:hypothetical protein